MVILISILINCSKQKPPENRVPTPEPLISDDYLIIPGKRAGIFQLGEPIGKLESILGKGLIAPREDFQIYSFVGRNVDVGVQKDLVTMILVMNNKYSTKEGIRIGERVSPAVRIYGTKYEYSKAGSSNVDYLIQYWDAGISFSVKNERIVKIKLFNQKLAITQMKERQ